MSISLEMGLDLQDTDELEAVDAIFICVDDKPLWLAKDLIYIGLSEYQMVFTFKDVPLNMPNIHKVPVQAHTEEIEVFLDEFEQKLGFRPEAVRNRV